MTKRERCLRAKECHEKGLNCGQSVLLAFTDVTGLTEAQSMAVASGFGGGLRRLCGGRLGLFLCAAGQQGKQQHQLWHRKRNALLFLPHLLNLRRFAHGIPPGKGQHGQARNGKRRAEIPCKKHRQRRGEIG